MSNQKDKSTIDQCIARLKDGQNALCEGSFPHHHIPLQQALEDHRHDLTKVTQVKDKLAEEAKRSKSRTTEFQKAEDELLLTQDLHIQKKRCLETLLYVSEIENVFQNVQTDMEDRALYLSGRPKVFESVYRGQDLDSQTRMHKECVYALRDSWQWLRDMVACLDTHTLNAALFHQFHHEAKALHQDMLQYLEWLAGPTVSAPVVTTDPDVMAQHFRMLVHQVLDYQGRVERLAQRSREVPPVHYRREMPGGTLKATAMVDYTHKDISLKKGEIVTVTDNSDPEKWMVRTSVGVETSVSAIVLVIPPPDPACFQEINRLRDQMHVHNDTLAQKLRSHLLQFLPIMVKNTQPTQLQGLSSNQKSSFLTLANEATDLLCGSALDDPEATPMKAEMTHFRKLVSQVKPGDKDLLTPAVQRWNTTSKLLRQYKELLAYGLHFQEQCASSSQSETVIINELGHGPRFTSKAYFQRVIPTIDVDPVTKETKWTSFKSEIVIHERHRDRKNRPLSAHKHSKLRSGSQLSPREVDAVDGSDPARASPEVNRKCVISGVIDPKTGQKLSMSQAIARGIINKDLGTYNDPVTGKSMSIAEAIAKGLIAVEYSDALTNGHSGDDLDLLQNSMDTKAFSVSGVMDPRTGEMISVAEAVKAGILDPVTGKFRNPVTGEELSLLDAVRGGYLSADLAMLEGLGDPGSPYYNSYMALVLEDAKYKVTGVVDPVTGQEMTLAEAIKAGIIDPDLGLYRNPHTGETMPLEEAIRRGLINCRPFDPSRDTDDDAVLTFSQMKVKRHTFKAGEPGLVNGDVAQDPNEALLDRLRDQINTAKVTVVDPNTGETISLEDAITAGLIDLAKGTWTTADGEVISLQEACSRGHLDPTVLQQLMGAYQGCSLADMIVSGELDPDTGLITDLKSGHTHTLQAAIEGGHLDSGSKFFFDVAENKITSLAEAIEADRLDKSSGKILHSKTNAPLTVSSAIKQGQIVAEISPSQLAEKAEALGLLRGCMDTSIQGVKVPGLSSRATVEEAVVLGALSIPKASYADEATVGTVTLQLAVQMEKVEPETALAIFAAFDELSLEKAIRQGKFDPSTSLMVDPDTRTTFTLDKARDGGATNPDYVFLVDEESGNITTLGALVEIGKLDPESGYFVSDTHDVPMTMREAIAQGLLLTNIEPAKYVDMSSSLKDLIDSGKVNPRSTDFVAGEGLRMSLRDGLANGFLTMSSRVTLDPESGEVTLVSDEAVVQSLIEVKEQSEWLVDIERALASQGRPSERVERLRQQAEDCQGLKHEISNKDGELKEVIMKAETLALNSVKGQEQKGQSKVKDETAQQFQKLKFSAADLKVRFDMVASETSSRVSRLAQMEGTLEEMYFHMEELDQWLDDGLERAQELGRGDVEGQYEAFKEFLEEVKDKEEDMSAIVKSADTFKDDAQEVERDVDAFRKRLDILPTIREDVETGVLDEELEALEAKVKDINKECNKQMDRLSALVKHKKVFDDLQGKLSVAYPALMDRLSALIDEDFGLDPHKGAQDLEALREVKADLIGHERKLKDLVAAGDRLATGLSDAGLGEDAGEVTGMVELQKESHRTLMEDIQDHEALLGAAVAEQENVVGRLEAVECQLLQAEDDLGQDVAVSLDKEQLGLQLQGHRMLKATIQGCQVQLERLSQEASGNVEAEDKIAALQGQCEELDAMVEERTQEMEDVLANIVEFESRGAELEEWLNDSIKGLKPKGGAPKPTKAKVDAVHEVKKEKEGEMRALREMCADMLTSEGTAQGYAMKETLADVEGKWNDLTELLVQQVSLEALSEIDGMLKYLDKAENEINTAEPISVDPETLSVQLRDHKSFDEDLKNKRNAVRDIIDKCTRMLRETTNAQTDEIKSRLDSIKTQADVVCQLSAERLHQLEAALPLATHYGENQTETSSWLEEMEAELGAQGEPGGSLEQVKKQHDNLKATQQIIEDHKLFIDDLNSTGLELMDVCAESDAVDIQNKLLDINKRYEGLKSQARGKGRDLTEVKRKFTQEAGDTLDQLLEELDGLQRHTTSADPIPASPDKLKNEIDENKAVLEDLDRQKASVEKAEEIVDNLKAHGVEDPHDAEDLKQKMQEIEDMSRTIRAAAQGRDKALTAALKLSEKFYDLSTDVLSGLRDLKDSLYSQEPPGVEPEGVKEQQAELAGLKKELEKGRELVGECKRLGAELTHICGEPGAIEVRKQLEDLGHLTDDVNDAIRDRGDELRKAFTHAEAFKRLLESVNNWLPQAEQTLASMGPPDSDAQALQGQLGDLKTFKATVHPHITEMQQLNQELAALRDTSPVAAEGLGRQVKGANERWAELLRGLTDRETKLGDQQLRVGEVSMALHDMTTGLDACLRDLEDMDTLRGDPKFLETHMRKLQLMQSDLRNKEKAAKKLNKAVEDMLGQEGVERAGHPLVDKQREMNTKMRATQATSREKENRLQEAMRQVKKFMGQMDDQLATVNEFRADLKVNQPFGALPDTAQDQYTDFLEKCGDLDEQEASIEGLLTRGQAMLDKCRAEDAGQVADRVRRLQDRWTDTRDRARKRKDKMEEHLENVSQFHETLKTFTDWLNNAEMKMRTYKYPSKLVDTVTQQIQEHEAMRTDLESQADKMAVLERTGTFLKHFGRKQDTTYVKNLLVGMRLRWKKLLRRADERGRLLQQAQREDQRFDESWRSLCEWLDESMVTLDRYLTPNVSIIKQDIDELKKIDLIRKFNHHLTAKHPTFYSTTRLGRNLKDRCTKQDPERDVLHGMVESLKAKWNSVRTIVSKSQNKLDEALLTSGRVSDALVSLLEWLHKAEAALDQEAHTMGDLDTVHMLIEQHRNIQQELAAREATVLTMKAPGNLPQTQGQELSALWDRVTHLGDLREERLREALKLAEEFQDVVTVMREFLPTAEAQLKFRALPEDEMVILQLIEKHEKFQESLRGHQESVDRIKGLAEEILQGCHPNAVRFVKYYLTITQTRWDQLLQRAENRGARLQEALRNIQGNAALLEELLAWLTDAQALLATKERDPIPDDLKVVETLLKEHLEFHEEVTSKNNDAERLSKLVTTESKAAAQGKGYGSNMKLNEFDGYNPRVIALQNKWRTVWRMSVERKKQLQDAHDTLLELESFKNFDFDLWRQRYLNWIQAKKFRITDFFRRQDKDSDGFVTRDEFVSGMLKSKFPSNRTELNAVFDIFDGNNRELIEYKNFVDALKTDKKSRAKNNNRKSKSDVELIHEEIEKELSACSCRAPFRAEWLDEGKYRFGEKQKTCLVRFLNHTVMVRVGGGWVTLEEFVDQNDPCKVKGRTNFDLRDTLALPDGHHSSGYNSRRNSQSGRTSPFPTGASRRRPQNDTGYASSNSSGSDKSSLRRSRITSSMVNLAGAGSPGAYTPSSLARTPDAFGSTGNLTRTKRLSTSSSNISGRKTPTSTNRNSLVFTQRSKTPTHAFGSAVSSARSRPTTPTFSPHSSSTPQRPGSSRPGSVTPTNGLNSSLSGSQTNLGPTRPRRLPSTPRTPTSSTSSNSQWR